MNVSDLAAQEDALDMPYNDATYVVGHIIPAAGGKSFIPPAPVETNGSYREFTETEYCEKIELLKRKLAIAMAALEEYHDREEKAYQAFFSGATNRPDFDSDSHRALKAIAALDKPITRAEDFMLLAEAAKRDGLA